MENVFYAFGIMACSVYLLERAFGLYAVYAIRQHDKHCADCADELMGEAFKRMREDDDR